MGLKQVKETKSYQPFRWNAWSKTSNSRQPYPSSCYLCL